MAISSFIEANLKRFEGWECDCCSYSNASGYDALINEFRDILKRYSLIGFHCTRLTNEEIKSIRSNGMVLQNSASLNLRIDRLFQCNLISPEIAQCLKEYNQANDANRANKLWFCFFEPFIAGEYGIGRLFRSWGGEALYNSHESNPVTGKVLCSFGTPCIVKANVPIASLKKNKFPDGALARVLLSSSGHHLRIPIEHEGYSIHNVAAQNIIKIFEYPSEEFIQLTKCKEWTRYTI